MFYLIGKPLGHSYSVPIHRAFGEYEYSLREIDESELCDFIKNGDWEGLNVTIPYKQRVIPYLDKISPEAEKIGSVNTVVRTPEGLVGYNTDYYGALAMAHRAGISFDKKKVVIMGAGGTSLTLQALARDAGAAEVIVVDLEGENNYGNISRHADADILINTTPVGMYPKCDARLIQLDMFRHLDGVLDVVYNPLRTRLIADAEARNIKCSGGLYMLVGQAAFACGYFSGKKKTIEDIDRVYAELLRNMGNIILVGMPGSGKSTVGRLIASAAGKEFVDTDELVTDMAGMPIPEYFTKYGENSFRDLESRAIAEAGAKGGRVIATGGGAVLRDVNLAPLTQNGRVYFILREIDKLSREGRPLSQGSDLLEMYRSRLPRYIKFADVSVDNNSSPDDCAKEIMEDYYENFGAKRTKS